MPNLQLLKTRLAKLPQLKAERHLSMAFGDYGQKVEELYVRLQQTHKDMTHASAVNSNPDYDRNVLSELKKAVRIAKKLHQEIEEDPQKVSTRATDNKVVRLREHTDSARAKCDKIWEQEITGSVAKWEKIAVVVQDIGAKGGPEFKRVVDSLKRQAIPQNENDVKQVRAQREELKNRVARLGLGGSFGKFLKATAERGASPRDLLEDEIREKMDKHELWDSFRVLLER